MGGNREFAAIFVVVAMGIVGVIWMAADALGLPFGIAAWCLARTAGVLVLTGGSLFWSDQWSWTRFHNVAPLLLALLWASWWPALDVWDTVRTAASPLDYINTDYAIRAGAWWATSWAKWLPSLALGAWTVQRIQRDAF